MTVFPKCRLFPQPVRGRSGRSPARAPDGEAAPIPDVGRVPGRSGDGTEQRLCFVQPISGASPLNRCWPTFLPIS